MKKLIIIGPPGSGKGTQAELLSDKFKMPHISVGALLRKMAGKDTSFGRKIKNIIDKGKLVDDEITFDLILNRLSQKDAKKGYILDGFPRKLSQAKFLHENAKIDAVILLMVSDKESARRISARKVCQKCGENYNSLYLKPKKVGVCDKCSGKLAVRDDDKPLAVRERLKKYHLETVPVLKFFEREKLLIKINGHQHIKKVFDDIKQKI